MVATRLRTGIAASAVAIAATVLAPPAAQAAPMVPVPNAPLTGITSPALAPTTLRLGNLATDLFFFGTAPNPSQPPSTTILAIKPITLLPGALQPLFGWFSSLNLDVCIAGVGLHIGAYGTVSATIARTC